MVEDRLRSVLDKYMVGGKRVDADTVHAILDWMIESQDEVKNFVDTWCEYQQAKLRLYLFFDN